MRILAILVILALATPASAQCPEALPSLEKQVKELEAALERAKRGEIDVERPAPPPLTEEQRLEQKRRELRSLQPVIREVYRCGRWVPE